MVWHGDGGRWCDAWPASLLLLQRGPSPVSSCRALLGYRHSPCPRACFCPGAACIQPYKEYKVWVSLCQFRTTLRGHLHSRASYPLGASQGLVWDCTVALRLLISLCPILPPSTGQGHRTTPWSLHTSSASESALTRERDDQKFLSRRSKQHNTIKPRVRRWAWYH